MIHRAAALADLFYLLCSQPGVLCGLSIPYRAMASLTACSASGACTYPINLAGVARMRVIRHSNRA
jgi:hypothetical protein